MVTDQLISIPICMMMLPFVLGKCAHTYNEYIGNALQKLTAYDTSVMLP